METVRQASVLGCGHAPGLRKLTPQMLGTIEVAETHKFLSEMQPGQVLAAFKAAAPYLGLRPNVVHAIDWLFRFTDPLDWQPSSRPSFWIPKPEWVSWPTSGLKAESSDLPEHWEN